MMKRSFKYRIYPTKAQSAIFEATLENCRQLYNAALQERIEAYKLQNKSLTRFDQINEIAGLRDEQREFSDIYSGVLYDVITRVDRAYQNFFRRVREGREKCGFPRFKGKTRYDSFSYADIRNGFAISEGSIKLPKNLYVKTVFDRPLEGTPKVCTIKREVDQWFAVISCDAVPEKLLPKTGESVGIDVGIEYFATLSNGEHIKNPRHAKRAKAKLRRAQRKLSRAKKGSNRRKKQVIRVAKIHRKIKRQRRHFHFEISVMLVRRFDLIKFEKLNIRNMVKNSKLAFSISDAAWNQFQLILAFKAVEAGKQVEFVNARNTSNKCSASGVIKKKKLYERWHLLPSGEMIHRDHNAAINILNSTPCARRGQPINAV